MWAFTRRASLSARLGAGPRRAHARQFGVFSGSRGADAAGAHLQRSLLAGAGRAAWRARGADGDRQPRAQTLAQLSSYSDALRRQAELRAGAGGHRRTAG